METNHPEEYDPLDALLRGNSSHIEDGNFTARVMSVLPRRHSRFWLRPALLLGSAGVGLVMALLWVPWNALTVVHHQALQSAGTRLFSPWILVLSVVLPLMLAITAGIQCGVGRAPSTHL
jgi:hypothetical protein